MAVKDLLQSITENLQNSATVKKVYGDPVAAEGKTIIPIAKIKYGFGAGGGKKAKTDGKGADSAEGESGGGGGGVQVIPVGYIEVGQKSSEYIPIGGTRKIAGFLAGGIALGFLLATVIKEKKWLKQVFQ